MLYHGRGVFEDVVAEDHDDHVSRLVGDQLERGRQVHSGAGAGDDRFLAIEPQAQLIGFLVGDLDFRIVLAWMIELGLLQLAKGSARPECYALPPAHCRGPWTLAFFSLRNRPVPVIVPQVPRPATKWVTFPSVCRQISGPVVL